MLHQADQVKKRAYSLSEKQQSGNKNSASSNDSSASSRSSRLDKMAADIASVRSQRDALRRRIEKLVHQREEVRKQLTATRDRLEVVRGALEKSRQREKLLEGKVVLISQKLEESRSTADVLREQKRRQQDLADEKISKLQEKLDAARATADVLREQKRRQQDLADAKISKLQEKLDAARATAGVLREQKQRQQDLTKKRLGELQGKVDTYISAADLLRKQRSDLRDKLALVRGKASASSLDREMMTTALGLPSNAKTAQLKSALGLLAAEATMTQGLEKGVDLDSALVATVRKLVDGKLHVRARSLSQALLDEDRTKAAGHLGLGLVAGYQKLHDLAHHHLSSLPADYVLKHAPSEWLSLQFAADASLAYQTVQDNFERFEHDHKLLLNTTRFAYREKRRDLGKALLFQLKSLEDKTGDALNLDRRDMQDYTWLQQWEASAESLPIDTHANEVINIGILDYKQPDFLRQSANLGDYVQTLGAMGHLVSFSQARLIGEASVVEAAELLRARIRPELVNSVEVNKPVRLVRVNRDASRYDAVPQDTWLISFGWYMHTTFGGAFDFPFNSNVRPIFVSFHVQHRNMLSPAVIEYLRQHEPIGCRDWTTTYLLLSAGVEAFFSGCLTTTVDAFFPEPEPEKLPLDNDEVTTAVVDTPVPEMLIGKPNVEVITHASDDVCRSDFASNIRRAVHVLDEYRSYQSVVTSRLHCYLPATALGCHVNFVPPRLSDVRFDGLLGLSFGDAALKEMQNHLREKLRTIYEKILAGGSPEDVYAAWRRTTASDVEEAKRKFEAPALEIKPSFDEVEACARVRAAGVLANVNAITDEIATVNVALAADKHLQNEVPVVLESILQNTKRPVHFWFLSRGYDRGEFDELARTFPEARFTLLPCDSIDYGPISGMLKHITVSTMDRLLLPLLLKDIDRAVYHDVDAVTLSDIGELYDMDLRGHALAARTTRASWAENGFANVYRSANRLEPEDAFELRRRMHQTLDFDFSTFNAGIMLLDLKRMRADNFSHRYIPFAEHYGMNDQEILNCYAGAERLVLDPDWNALPLQEVTIAPKIMHWAGPAKPWNEEHVAYKNVWRRYLELTNERKRSSLDLG